jgi:hypothetical protein
VPCLTSVGAEPVNVAPDDFIDPKQLNPLARSYLREAFRAVASVQAGLAAELSLGVRWG